MASANQIKVRIDSLCLNFGGVIALNDVSVDIDESDISYLLMYLND